MANSLKCRYWFADSQEALDYCKLAFTISEEFDTPVMLRITTRLAHSQTMVEVGSKEEYQLKPYKKNVPKYVMLPGHARGRHVEVEKRMMHSRSMPPPALLTGLNGATGPLVLLAAECLTST